MKKEVRVRDVIFSIMVLFVMMILVGTVYALVPSGATLAPIDNQTAPADTPSASEAFAGNVTEVDIFGYTTTQSWQGYYGNITGTIQLADANDNVMYNWSVASPEGEVYASTNNTVDFPYLHCFNHTATGTFDDETATAGGVSQNGVNMTQLEEMYGIAWDDVDGVNETFMETRGHDLFYAGPLEFTADECLSTQIYDATGASVDNNFEEVLMYEPTTGSIVFTSILDEEGPDGFDARQHDFEMLVLENGHGTDRATTTYYFWVELQ